MKNQEFKEAFVKSFGEELSGRYIPGLSHRMISTLVLQHLVDVSAANDFIIFWVKVDLKSYGELNIEVNSDIRIQFFLSKEVSHAASNHQGQRP